MTHHHTANSRRAKQQASACAICDPPCDSAGTIVRVPYFGQAATYTLFWSSVRVPSFRERVACTFIWSSGCLPGLVYLLTHKANTLRRCSSWCNGKNAFRACCLSSTSIFIPHLSLPYDQNKSGTSECHFFFSGKLWESSDLATTRKNRRPVRKQLRARANFAGFLMPVQVFLEIQERSTPV